MNKKYSYNETETDFHNQILSSKEKFITVLFVSERFGVSVFASVLVKVHGFRRSFTFSLTTRLPLVCLSGISSGYRAIPRGMMSPGPTLGHRAIGHRVKCSLQCCRPFVYVNDEPPEHNKRRDVVNDVTNHRKPARNNVAKPHQQPCDQE